MSRLRRLVGAAALVLTMALAAACGTPVKEEGASQQPQGAALRIKLGTQDFPEAKIMGELWRQALAVNGYTVDLQKGVGPAAELDKLLQERQIDGHVAYTGTVLSVVAGQPVSGLDPQATYEQAKAFYATRNMAMSAMTPFENKDAIATTKTYAQTNQLSLDRRPEEAADVPARRAPGVRRPVPRAGRAWSQVYGLSQRRASCRCRWASSTPRWTTARRTRSTPSPPTRSCSADDYEVLADPQLLFGSQNVVMTVDSTQAEGGGGAEVPGRGRRGEQPADPGRDRRAERRGHQRPDGRRRRPAVPAGRGPARADPLGDS